MDLTEALNGGVWCLKKKQNKTEAGGNPNGKKWLLRIWVWVKVAARLLTETPFERLKPQTDQPTSSTFDKNIYTAVAFYGTCI